MPYDVTLVQINAFTTGLSFSGGYMGFPPNSNFSTVLYSQWICAPSNSFGQCVIGAAFTPFLAFSPNGTIALRNHIDNITPFFSGTFPAPTAGVRAHTLLSIDTQAEVIQLYVNDQPVTVTGTWTGAPGTKWFNFGGFSSNIWHWNVGNTLSTGLFPGVADSWCAATPSFVDLTVTANRRKFINADLTPVFLGANGSAPFGVQPQIYCTVQSGGVPADILTNHGTGDGPFVYNDSPPTFQAPGICTLPPPPPTPPPKLAIDNVIATAIATQLEVNLISLRWSDDRGHSWGSPVTQDIGEAGEYRTSLQWQRLAYARDRCFEISWSVPMRTALQGCWVDVTPAQS